VFPVLLFDKKKIVAMDDCKYTEFPPILEGCTPGPDDGYVLSLP
jgi:hypothetical protein